MEEKKVCCQATGSDPTVTISAEFVKALSNFQKECPDITFDAEVSFKNVKFKYATLQNIQRTIAPSMAKNGLAVSQLIRGDKLYTILMHSSGSWMESWVHLPKANDMKMFGANVTYLKRYSLCSTLGVSGEEDRDAIEKEKREKETKLLEQRFAKHITNAKSTEELERCKVELYKNSDEFPDLIKAYEVAHKNLSSKKAA